jgi:hypothetical protein
LSCIGQFSLEEIESPINEWNQVEPGVCQEWKIGLLRMRDLLHVPDEREECSNALLRGLGHPEWIP